MNRIQTKALVEGALFAAITVVIGVIRFYVPVVSLISIVWSVPTILIAFRHGFKVSINSVVASSVLVAFMTQPVEGLGFFIGFGLPGIIMGYLLKKQLRPEMTVLLTGLALAISSVVSIYLAMLAVGVDMANVYDKIFIDMKNAFNEAAASLANTYNTMGISGEDLLKKTEVFERGFETIRLILPGGILVSAIVISFINFKLSRLVLKRINYFLEDIKPFSLWRLSNKWAVIVMLVLLYALVEIAIIKLPQLYAFTMNIFSVTVIIFMIMGLSAAKFFLDKYKIPKAVKGIIMVLLVLAFSNILTLIGIFDMTFDLRKLGNKPIENI